MKRLTINDKISISIWLHEYRASMEVDKEDIVFQHISKVLDKIDNQIDSKRPENNRKILV